MNGNCWLFSGCHCGVVSQGYTCDRGNVWKYVEAEEELGQLSPQVSPRGEVARDQLWAYRSRREADVAPAGTRKQKKSFIQYINHLLL